MKWLNLRIKMETDYEMDFSYDHPPVFLWR